MVKRFCLAFTNVRRLRATMNKVTIDNGGASRFPTLQPGRSARKPWSWFPIPGATCCSLSPAAKTAWFSRVFSGSSAVVDLLSFFNMFRKTGILRFRLAGGTKALYFQQGEIVFATSTFPEEDMGEVLFELGKVEREVLAEGPSVGH